MQHLHGARVVALLLSAVEKGTSDVASRVPRDEGRSCHCRPLNVSHNRLFAAAEAQNAAISAAEWLRACSRPQWSLRFCDVSFVPLRSLKTWVPKVVET